MKLYPDKFEAHLRKALAPVYLLHGDEPLQIMELGDRLREQARAQGFDERQVIFVNDSSKDDSAWFSFREAADSFSLFSERRLIELRLPTGKPGRVGAEVLKQYCSNPPADVLLLITSDKLDRNGSSSAWFKAIDKVGVTLAVRPLDTAQLQKWLTLQLAAKGLRVRADTLELIADRVEGNQLAARQEVERLALLYPAGELGSDQILAAVSDSARYSIGDLSLAALNGEPVRALRILDGLHDEAVSEVLILWSLVNEIRAGTRAAEAVDAGVGEDAALKSAGVWQSRAVPLKQALVRHSAVSWLSMLSACTTIDRQIKGQAAGSYWDALAALTTQLAGHGEIPLKPNEGIPV